MNALSRNSIRMLAILPSLAAAVIGICFINFPNQEAEGYAFLLVSVAIAIFIRLIRDDLVYSVGMAHMMLGASLWLNALLILPAGLFIPFHAVTLGIGAVMLVIGRCVFRSN